MYEELGISKETIDYLLEEEKKLDKEFNELEEQSKINHLKVLNAFHKYNVSENYFNSTTGYGYNDYGRENIEKIFATVLDAEDAIVRNQFISGTHALTVTLFALLRPNDLMLSISGLPYDTLHEVIGIVPNKSSLASYNIKYDQIDLIDNDFDYEGIKNYLKNNKVKLIEIQRSKGYSTRKSITIDKIEKVIKEIRTVDKEVIIMVDNCYCEFIEQKTPTSVGADIMVGSLIKNLGAGIAPNGAYATGRKDLIDLVGERLTCPGEGREVGPTLGINKQLLQGLYFAPQVVKSALKIAILTSIALEDLGYEVEPKYNEPRADIVQNIIFKDEQKLISYVQGIQAGSPIDSNALPIPSDMPGYEDKIIMASGSFNQGSTIEFSCDAPIRPPYIAYQQGGLSYEYGFIGLARAIEELKK